MPSKKLKQKSHFRVYDKQMKIKYLKTIKSFKVEVPMKFIFEIPVVFTTTVNN